MLAHAFTRATASSCKLARQGLAMGKHMSNRPLLPEVNLALERRTAAAAMNQSAIPEFGVLSWPLPLPKLSLLFKLEEATE